MEDFVTLDFSVRDYGGGDLHIQDNTTGVKIRISHSGSSIAITSSGNQLIPWSINGLPAFLVAKGK